MSDCDSHGTLTASIIAGRPAPTDGFIGVAPDARILSLRQTSDNFQPVGARNDPNDPNTTPDRGFAAQPGPVDRARGEPGRAGDQHQRGGLLQDHPSHRRVRPRRGDRVRGQRQGRGRSSSRRATPGRTAARTRRPIRRYPSIRAGGSRCRPSSRPRGTRRWCSPSAASRPNGQPSSFSMSGPWVGAAAPAENIIALGYDGNPVNALAGAGRSDPDQRHVVRRGVRVGSGRAARQTVPRPDARSDHQPDHRHRKASRRRRRQLRRRGRRSIPSPH